MSYMNLFAEQTAKTSGGADINMSSLDTEALYAEQLLENLDALGQEEMELSRQGDMVEAMMGALEANQNSKGAANVVFAMINHMSEGNAETVTGHSMESFSDDFSMEALDGIKNAIGAAYDAVIKMIEDLIRNVKSFLGEFFDKFPKLKKQAEKLREKAEDIEGSISEKKIKIGGAHGVLCGGDKKITGLPASLKLISELRKTSGVDQFGGWLKDQRIEDFEGDAESIKNLSRADIMKGGNSKVSLIQGLCKLPRLKSDQLPKALAGRDAKGQVNLPGDKILAFTSIKNQPALSTDEEKANDTLKVMGSIKLGFYDQSEKTLDVKDAEADTLDSSEVIAICDAVEEVCETYAKSRKEVEEGLKQQERILKVLKKVRANVDKKDYKDVKPRLNLIKNVISNLSKLATQPAQKLSAYAYSVSAASLSYGDKSLAQYKKD